MRILLLGEASGVHSNLKKGLSNLGHNVTLVSSGDGFKQIHGDVILTNGSKGYFSSILRGLNWIRRIYSFRGYDVVQIISVEFFPKRFALNYMLSFLLRVNNKRLFIVGAGCIDSWTCDFFKNEYKYPEFYKSICNHYGVASLWGQSPQGKKFNNWLFDIIDGYIPLMYEYSRGHVANSHGKLRRTVPIPIDLESFDYEENIKKEKVVIFHGVSRKSVKGSDAILEVLNRLQDQFPNDVEILIVEKVPYHEYVGLLRRANIVVDQMYSVSTGVNGLIAMALGKILVGGGEEEFLTEFKLKNSPIISFKKDNSGLYKSLKKLLQKPETYQSIGEASRVFVENLHNANAVASKYIEVWDEN